ncbi:hypothetical protein CRG98_048120, partial [Punica granatum]
MYEGKSRGSGRGSREKEAAAALSGEWVGTLAPATARCEVGLVGLLRDGSRLPWARLMVCFDDVNCGFGVNGGCRIGLGGLPKFLRGLRR